MVKRMKESYKIGLIAVGLVAIVGFAFAISVIDQHNEGVGSKEVTATVVINFENGTKWNFSNIATHNKTVLGFLMSAANIGNFTVETSYYGQYDSILVDSIASVPNGNGKFWQYYINGNYGMLGADKQIVKDGDIIEWRFESSNFT